MVISQFGHNNITFDSEIIKHGKTLLKNKFYGIFKTRSEFNKLKNNTGGIYNTDLHWIAIFKINNKLYEYDSFNRDFFPTISNYEKTFDDNKPDQLKTQNNCGQRSIAILYAMLN